MSIEDYNKFRKEFMGSHYSPMSNKDLQRLKSNSCVIEVKDDEKVIGLAVVNTSNSLTRRAMVIEDIIVDKDHRRKGISKGMMNSILKMAKSCDCDCIEVATKINNTSAQNLYRSFGFKARRNRLYRLWVK
jgi:ribosomal protein S18 acetylase RimI-like enzyme